MEEGSGLESNRGGNFDVMEQMNYTRTAMAAKNKDLEYKCKQHEKEIDRLKDKLHLMSVQVNFLSGRNCFK